MTNQEIDTKKEDRPILMRNGLIHWVTDNTADRLRSVLASQTAHSFVALTELGITINTADITGVYTAGEYDDLMKLKEGMHQCKYRKWHRKKEECRCFSELQDRIRMDNEQRKRDEENRPMTEEEIKVRGENLRRMNETYALASVPGGMFRQMFREGNDRGRKIRRSTILEWERENGKADVEGLSIEENVL